MGTIAEKLTYLNTTKIKLRDSLNKFGSNILSTDTFRSYDTKLNEIYDKLPKVTQSGAGLTITPVQNGQVDDFKMIGTDLEQNQLPSEYTAVEYLQSDNECYIDTGINADYKLSLKLKMACLNTTQIHMGAIKNNNGSYIRHHLTFNPTNPKFIGVYAGETNILSFLKEFDNNFHEFNLDIYNKKISIDNDSAIAISYNNFDVGINYYLFARNGSNIEINKGTYKIYYCKMYYEDKLVRDFAPCYRNSDNVAGLYDFVTNTFFTNQGTGTFTVGNTITLPNPDYPQEIKVVEGRQVITDSGKNLLKPYTEPSERYGITASYNQNTHVYTFNGTCTRDNVTFILSNNKINFTTQVTKSITFWVGGSCTNSCDIRHFDSNYNSNVVYSIVNISSTNNKISKTSNYTFESPINYATIRFNNGSVANNLQIKVMVTDDDNTDYEPYYNPVSYNIDLHGKNVFNLEKYPFTPKVAYSSTGYQELNWTGYSGIKDYFPINGNTTYSFSNSTGLDIYYGLVFYDKNKTIISNITAHTTTFTTPSNCEYIRFSIHTEELPTWVQIEEGSTTTNYEDYYDYKLAKIPNTNYKNRIYKNNGNWYYEKNVEKFILDGSETWDSASSITNTSRFYTSSNILNSRYSDDNNVYIIADKFKGISWKGIYSNDTTTKNAISNYNHSSNTSGRIVIRIDNNYASTTNEFKTWLSTHNVIVYYALATPVTTQITNTTLINQLEAISLHTGTNIITISNDNNIIPEIEITRLKELEKLA